MTQTHPCQLVEPCDEQWGRGSGGWPGSPRPGCSCVLPSLAPQEGSLRTTYRLENLCNLLWAPVPDLCMLLGLLACSILSLYLCGVVGIYFMLWVMIQHDFALLLKLLQL